jgi:micrococcal nuclease
LATAVLVCLGPALARPCEAGRTRPQAGTVKAVFDGDTIALDNGEKVRYLGVDAPEIANRDHPGECYGEQASRINQELVLHRRVTLEYQGESRDRYGRWLAYVFLEDGRCVNLELVGRGAACVDGAREGFGRFQEFLAVQRRAIRERIGMWASCQVESESHYLGNRASHIFHRPTCPFGRQVGKNNQVRFRGRLEAFEQGFRPCHECKP